MIRQFDSLMSMMETLSDEQACIDHLRAIRWKNGVYCPHCGSTKVYRFSDNRTHKCGNCRQRFSIKVGTIMGIMGTRWRVADQGGAGHHG